MQITELERVAPAVKPIGLLAALQQLDIQPFKQSMVDKYKHSKEKKTMWSGHKIAFFVLAPIIPLASLICFTLFYFAGQAVAEFVSKGKGVLLGQSCFMLLCALFMSWHVIGLCQAFRAHLDPMRQKGYRTVFQWRMFDYSLSIRVPELSASRNITTSHRFAHDTGYYVDVPFFVQNKANQIKEHIPNATLGVDVLMKDDEITPDPFLVVSLGDEKYYVEAWDEKALEDKL